jgi:hypothetical protein
MTRDAIEQYAEALRPRYRRETKGEEAILRVLLETAGPFHGRDGETLGGSCELLLNQEMCDVLLIMSA